MNKLDDNPVLFGQLPSLVQTDYRRVHGGHVVTLFREEDGVAPFTFGQTKNFALRNVAEVLFQKLVRLCAVRILLGAVSFIPHPLSPILAAGATSAEEI